MRFSFLSAVAYPVDLLPENPLFGSSHGVDGDLAFQFQGNASLFSRASTPERSALLYPEGSSALRSIMTTALLEDVNQFTHEKPEFIFGDAAPDTDNQLSAGEGQWIYRIGEDKFYLPSNPRHFPLYHFANITKDRKTPWHLNPGRDSVHLKRLTPRGPGPAGHPDHVIGLLPGLHNKEVPANEVPHTATTFLNYFVAA